MPSKSRDKTAELDQAPTTHTTHTTNERDKGDDDQRKMDDKADASKSRTPKKNKKAEPHLDVSSGADESIVLVHSDEDEDDDVLKAIDEVITKSKAPKAKAAGSGSKPTEPKATKNGGSKPKKRKADSSADPDESASVPKKLNGLSKTVSMTHPPAGMNSKSESSAALQRSSSTSKAQIQVCCVCLNKQSDGFNELVECDSCGFMVHEGCYGITDTDSKLSTNSEASTEPWFCNSCLLDDNLLPERRLSSDPTPFLNRSCELCPNTRCGLMKETDSGKFVHIVCALYTPSVAYYDTDILWPVVLDEIPAQSWGAQACSLCDDPLLSRTGVCIKCDAGLCRSYFHVTCAQKHGYLCDPTLQNENDPFIAYCKNHNDKPIISSRKTNHKLMLANLEEKWSNRSSRQFEYSDDRVRLSNKFENAKDNYQRKRQKHFKKPSTVKIPRMLTTCPSALKMLLEKTSLSGAVVEEIETNNLNRRNLGFHPTFTVEFLKYYLDREKKMPDYYKELHELKLKQKELAKQEEDLRHKLDSLGAHSPKKASQSMNGASTEDEKRRELLGTCVKLYETLFPKTNFKSIAKSPTKSVYSLLGREETSDSAAPACEKAAEPSYVTPKKSSKLKSTGNTPKSERKQESDGESTPKGSKSKRSKSTKENSVPVASSENSIGKDQIEPINLNACCSVCSKKTNSHLLIDCDSCKKYYHISCLNPPLTHMPKKTKLYGWECSFCVRKKDSDYEAEDDEEDDVLSKNSKSFTVFKRPKIDLEGSRQLRRERNKKVIFDS